MTDAMTIFCLPYAGGSANIFHDWRANTPSGVKFRPVELPGRGARFDEPPNGSLDSLVPALGQELQRQIDRPFAFFGHSMGALLAYELTRFFRRMAWPLPRHLFVSAACAPHRRRPATVWYDAPLPAFVEQLRRLNGAPAQALLDAELMRAVLPYLRADFRIVQRYRYTPDEPLSIPISAFGGIDDPDVRADEIDAWSELTTGPFQAALFAGDHFFLRAQQDALIGRITAALTAEEAHADLSDRVSAAGDVGHRLAAGRLT